MEIHSPHIVICSTPAPARRHSVCVQLIDGVLDVTFGESPLLKNDFISKRTFHLQMVSRDPYMERLSKARLTILWRITATSPHLECLLHSLRTIGISWSKLSNPVGSAGYQHARHNSAALRSINLGCILCNPRFHQIRRLDQTVGKLVWCPRCQRHI